MKRIQASENIAYALFSAKYDVWIKIYKSLTNNGVWKEAKIQTPICYN